MPENRNKRHHPKTQKNIVLLQPGDLFIPEHADTLELIPLFTETLFLISPGESNASKLKDVPFKELANAPLILPSRPHILRTLLEESAQSIGTNLEIMYEPDSMVPK